MPLDPGGEVQQLVVRDGVPHQAVRALEPGDHAGGTGAQPARQRDIVDLADFEPPEGHAAQLVEPFGGRIDEVRLVGGDLLAVERFNGKPVVLLQRDIVIEADRQPDRVKARPDVGAGGRNPQLQHQ